MLFGNLNNKVAWGDARRFRSLSADRGRMNVPRNGFGLMHVCSAMSNVLFTVLFRVVLPSYGGLPYTLPSNACCERPSSMIFALVAKVGFGWSMHLDVNLWYVLRMLEKSSL